MRKYTFTLTVFLLAASPAMMWAQAAAPAPDQTTTAADQANPAVPTTAQVTQPGAAPAEEPGVTKLPPFEVQASSKDIGYYTQNTTMGTRLNSNLGDLGASITVISKQQMTDTSSINLNDLFLYEASTEGAENFTNVGGTSKGTGTSDGVQSSPQTYNRIRGLGSVNVTRDFFLTNAAIPTDTYNIDDVELNRGPNSSLFGIGSPSGIVNLSIEKAVLNKDSNDIGFRFDNFGGSRATLNLNRALIPDKLSIAVAGLYENNATTEEKPAYDIQRREFAAVTLKPFPTTTIRANLEYINNPSQRPDSLTVADEMTPWLNAGRPSWDPITYTATVNGVTTAPITNNILVPAGLVGSLGNFGDGEPSMYLVHGKLQLWEQAELGTNFVSVGTPTSAVSGTNPFGPIGYERLMGTGGNYLKFASSAPAGQVTYPLFREPGINNPQLLNWQGINMFSDNTQRLNAKIYNVEVEQEVTDNLFLDAGWYRESTTTYINSDEAANAGAAMQVDPNSRFLNGAPNPYFGRPYIVAQQVGHTTTMYLNEQERVQAAYNLDFTKNNNWTKWLGHHNLLAFYQHQENDTQSLLYFEGVMDGHSWDTTTDIGGQNAIAGDLNQRFYLSDSGAAASYAPGFFGQGGSFTNGNFDQSAYTYPVTWYNTALNGGTWTNENARVGTWIEAGRPIYTQQQVWSYAQSLQDYFLNDRLIVTLGQRHDYERTRTANTTVVDPTTGFTDLTGLNNYSSWIPVDGITRQAGAVLHITKWLSVHYNQSDNFSVSGLAEDLFGNVLPAPTGHGKDYGISTSLFDDKLVAELNWYKSDAANARTGDTTALARVPNIDASMFIPWAQEIATNNLGASASATAINAYAQNIVKLPNGMSSFAIADNLTITNDSQSQQAKGIEFNLTYNPLRNWTMKFTADEDTTIYSQVFPHVQAWLVARLPVWQAASDPVLGTFWTTISAGNISTGGGTPQQYLAASVYAAGLAQSLALQNQVSPDLAKYHFNFLTNYVFATGPLKNFGIGGALRYESPQAIGYYGGAPDPSENGAIDTLNVARPFWSKETIHQDMWASYRFHLPFLDDKVRTTVQLNVKDLWSNGYLLGVAIDPDGSYSSYRIIPPRQIFLSVDFAF